MREFIDFINNPNLATFLTVRNAIITDKSYDPYSNDLDILNDLFVKQAYEEIAEYSSINILLSPLAHLIKSVSFEKLAKEDEAKYEMHVWRALIKGIELSGDGSASKPYVVARISDEKDFMEFKGDIFSSQSLVNRNGRFIDVISVTSGKEIYFDITDCYKNGNHATTAQARASEPLPLENNNAFQQEPAAFEEGEFEDEQKKKWWKFW